MSVWTAELTTPFMRQGLIENRRISYLNWDYYGKSLIKRGEAEGVFVVYRDRAMN